MPVWGMRHEIAKTKAADSLVDVQMPGMNGRADCEAKTIDPQMEITMISAYDDSDYILNAMKTGASYYLLAGTPSRDSCGIRQAFEINTFYS